MKETQDALIFIGNEIKGRGRTKAIAWKKRLAKKYQFNPDAKHVMTAVDNEIMKPYFGIKDIVIGQSGEPIDPKKGVVIGTIRMGYGHYRMSFAAVSAARAMGFVPYWHDLMTFPHTTATKIMKFMESLYNLGSKLSQKSKLFNKLYWEPIASKQWRHINWGANENYCSALLVDAFSGIPKDIPYISAFHYPGSAAVCANFKRVVQMIPDNWAMSTHIVDGAINAVQSPSLYYSYRTLRAMGDKGKNLDLMPKENLAMTGAYVDHEIVDNIEDDCERRVKRMKNKEARRLLFTIGGAGVQAELFAKVLVHLLPKVKDGSVAIFLNLGDHPKIYDYLKRTLDAYGPHLTMHTASTASLDFAHKTLDTRVKGIHCFLHDDIYTAVYLTNILMRSADVMVTKPSELAYYPVPKLFLPRVGGHEIGGGWRGSELGDATVECDDIMQVYQALWVLTEETDMIELYCDMIKRNKSIGLYDGAYKLIELATGKKWERR